jgi:hypothetical protein
LTTSIDTINVEHMARATDAISVVKKMEGETGEWLEALLAGRRRIGRTDLARLEWLLRFAEMAERSELLDERRAGLEAEVYAFIWSAGPAGSGPRPEELSTDTILRLQLRLRQGLAHLAAGRSWAFRVTDLERYVGPIPKVGFRSGYLAQNPEPAFLMRAADLITEEGARIRRCGWKDCGRLFVRHKGGLYCSKPCSQKARTNRLKRELEKRGENWTERRHSYYVRKIERLHGKATAAKVRRRKAEGK